MYMPLDKNMYAAEARLFYDRAVWYLKFAWWPHRCSLTGRLIWLRSGYQGTAMWTGPGDPVFERRWISRDQFLLAKLMGQI